MIRLRTARDVVEQVTAKTATARENAVALHDYVRDKVKFGFNKYFDAAPPEYTLAYGYGHCNPKSTLMTALFRASGFTAYQHFVVIAKDILDGIIPPSQFWMIPPEISHSFVEVQVEGVWCAIDSYIVDTPLLDAALTRLTSEKRSIGYSIRIGSINTWDGQRDAFSQFAHTMLIEDHGRIEDMDVYFRSPLYRNKAYGVRFNTVFKLMGKFGVAPINAYIERIRQTSF